MFYIPLNLWLICFTFYKYIHFTVKLCIMYIHKCTYVLSIIINFYFYIYQTKYNFIHTYYKIKISITFSVYIHYNYEIQFQFIYFQLFTQYNISLSKTNCKSCIN